MITSQRQPEPNNTIGQLNSLHPHSVKGVQTQAAKTELRQLGQKASAPQLEFHEANVTRTGHEPHLLGKAQVNVP